MEDDLLNKLKNQDVGFLEALIGSLLLGVPAVWMFIKNFLLHNKIADTKIAAADTRLTSENVSSDVIERLYKEIERLDRRITLLVEENARLHTENIELKKQAGHFSSTISRMQEEIDDLRMREG